jgi:hypothetical protein
MLEAGFIRQSFWGQEVGESRATIATQYQVKGKEIEKTDRLKREEGRRFHLPFLKETRGGGLHSNGAP